MRMHAEPALATRAPMRSKASVARELRRLRNQYAPEAEAAKRALMTAIAADPPRTAHALLHTHDDLLFMCAFPGETATLRAARRLLARTPAWVKKLPPAERSRLHDTGVAGSVTRHVYPFAVARWLARRAANSAEIDWRHYDGPSKLDRALYSVLRPSELEAAESGEVSTHELLSAARGGNAVSDLDWLTGEMCADKSAKKFADANWNEAEVPVKWDLGASRWSTTKNRLSGAPTALRKSMRRPPADPATRILEPMSFELAPRRAAGKIIELAQTALASRCREVLAISYPNPDEVVLCDLGEGVTLAVIGVAPEKRLNLETNTGYLLISNGAPVGYGGVTPLFRQANTGINIFDPYRGSEAAFLWVEMLRAFHSIYGVTRFVVNGYQFGEGNSEAINSGAYWFYYRLGFRPHCERRKALAAQEFKRLSRKGAAPSERSVLRALAKGDLSLETPGFDPADALDEGLLVKASLAATRRLAAAPGKSRADAEYSLADEAMRILGAGSIADCSKAELSTIQRFAPILLSLRDVGGWPPDDKRLTLQMIYAKARKQERDFALASGACRKFYRSLADLAAQAPSGNIRSG
jgi:hypothetical protein